MDQLIFAFLSHTHYWDEVGMLKVPAVGVVWCKMVLSCHLDNIMLDGVLYAADYRGDPPIPRWDESMRAKR